MLFQHDKPNFNTDGKRWPHRRLSRFVDAGGLAIHAQTMGEGEEILLLHGTGASTHSFRDMMPILAQRYRVTAIDLPGHAFSGTPLFTQMTLPGVADWVERFLRAENMTPVALVGHSAGVAVAVRMALDAKEPPRAVVGFNASLKPFAGAAGPIFSTMAKLLFVNPMTPRVLAATATKRRMEKLIADTGSKISAEGLSYYQTLFRRSGHVNGALSMMAGWDLVPLQLDLPRLKSRLTLVAGGGDRLIPGTVATASAAKAPHGHVVRVPQLGHLSHEEDPEGACEIVFQTLSEVSQQAA
ncbi:MAG: alpha/beta fold hydrolase BchO [Pseudomonadota bacterium]